MKNNKFYKNMLRNSLGFTVLLFVSMSCLCSKDSDKKDDILISRKTSRNNRNANSSNSVSALPSPESNSNDSDSTKSLSYQDNLPPGFKLPADLVGKRILSDYGAVYVAKGGVTPPPTVMFDNEDECTRWQSTLSTSKALVGGFNLELQEPAMMALQEAIEEAQKNGLSITPRGADSARRSYLDTVGLWVSRVDPALTFWTGKKRISQQDASRIKSLPLVRQVAEVLQLEEKGIFFSRDFSKSILYSVAAPGTSQHLSMLALDINEYENSKVREILAKHGWYQTVVSDLPHFTYLGVPESELPKAGLKKTISGGRSFWIPSF